MIFVFFVIGVGVGVFLYSWLIDDDFESGAFMMFAACVCASIFLIVGATVDVVEEKCIYSVIESEKIVKSESGYYREIQNGDDGKAYYVVTVEGDRGKHDVMIEKDNCYINDGEPRIEKVKCVGFKEFRTYWFRFPAAGGQYWTIYVPEVEE